MLVFLQKKKKDYHLTDEELVGGSEGGGEGCEDFIQHNTTL